MTTTSALCARVERALVLNRKARLNFPGIFMKLTGRREGDDAMTLEMPDDPTFRNAAGELNWPALGVFLDIVLGAVTRLKAGPAMRPATVRLDVQMTGAPTRGSLSMLAEFVEFSEGTRVKHAVTRGTIKAGRRVVARATGAFVMFELPPGQTQLVDPWLPEALASAPHEAVELEDAERAALEACRRAEAAATDAHPFIDHFWCGVPEAADGEARLAVNITPHLGNRVGHVHGGVLLGLAANVAEAAAPAGMRLSNVCAWFISPGKGERLDVRAQRVQDGRTLSVVRTQIVAADGKLVLEATSQHVAAAATAT